MSIPFNNQINGLIQLCEQYCGFEMGQISNNPKLLQHFTNHINVAIDNILGQLYPKGGEWQLDDYNYGDYPIIQTGLISGQTQYFFYQDNSGAEILDIYKIQAKDENGKWYDLLPLDQQKRGFLEKDFTNQPIGKPKFYDKTANGFFLSPVPDYSISEGLKVYINRTPFYFNADSTDQRFGMLHLFQTYLAKKASYDFCIAENIDNAKNLLLDVVKLEKEIKEYCAFRNKDVKFIMRNNFVPMI